MATCICHNLRMNNSIIAPNWLKYMFFYVIYGPIGFSNMTSIHSNTLGNEPADLTVHPPPSELHSRSSVGLFFSVCVSSVPKIMSSKESLNI